MRLTVLTQYYPPETGAPQARLSELAAHFVRRGHSVTVLTAMPNYPKGKLYPGYRTLLKRERQGEVEIIRSFIYPTQRASFVRRMANYLSFMFSSAAIGTFLLRRSDYLLVESPPLFLGLSAVWLSRLKRARLIFNVSDLWPESAVRLGLLERRGLAYSVSVWLEAFCYRRAWLITGQSLGILEDIRQRFPGYHVFHLSNGVDTQLFRPDRATGEVRASLSTDGTLVALYAGLHGLAQGLNQVLEAAAGLAGACDLRFVFVGDGPEKPALLEHAKLLGLSNVQFLQSIPAREIPALIASADIILVTLKLHIPGAVPSKLYEAMASGRPVVLVAEGEAAEIVRRHEAGLILQPGDIAGLIHALRTLYEQAPLRQNLGNNGRLAAEQNFDRTKIMTKFIDYLEKGLSA